MVTVSEYTMAPLGAAFAGAVRTTPTSASPDGSTVAVALAVAVPPVVAVALAESEMAVPVASPLAACSTSAKAAELPAAMPLELVQLTVPEAAPTAGVVHVQPAGAVIDSKRETLPEGKVSVKVTIEVARLPLLVTTG